MRSTTGARPSKGAAWINQAPLFLSVAVNLYVLVYVAYPRQAPAGGPSSAVAAAVGDADMDRLGSNRKLINSASGGVASSAMISPLAASSGGSGISSSTSSGQAITIPRQPEVWASGTYGHAEKSIADKVAAQLSQSERDQLRALCGRCLFQTLTKSLEVRGIGNSVFVATGDIPDEWIRDSSVQLAVYLPRIAQHPVLRPIVEGAIRTQAYYILSDPWANSYRQTWARPESMGKFERQIGRGGWIATRNFEVDSGAYFLNLLWNYANTPGLWNPAGLLNDTLVHDAVALMVDTWITEQHHEERSPYRYAELPRDGKGALTGYTGMIWSGFRPSDDANVYGFNVPVNMYAAGALERVIALNRDVWRDASLEARARKLADDVRAGIEKFGVVSGSQPYYAYEVDGLGNRLESFDDPNIPSLLSIPLLGFPHYDAATYRNTRSRILSSANSHYYQGTALRGCGSPHTPHNYVWSMAHCVQGLTAGSDIGQRVDLFKQLLQMQGDNGLMHESNDVNNPGALTRPLFQWANTLFVVLYEQTFGEDCAQVAEELRVEGVKAREAREKRQPQNGGADIPAYYDRLEQSINHVKA